MLRGAPATRIQLGWQQRGLVQDRVDVAADVVPWNGNAPVAI